MIKLKKVIKINREGMGFIDTENRECFVKFDDCEKNWMEELAITKSHGEKTINDLQNCKIIGYRSSYKWGFKIELYSKPRIVIEFRSFIRNLAFGKYMRFLERVEQSGWKFFSTD